MVSTLLVIIWFQFIYNSCSTQRLFKPTFNPYCSLQDLCKFDCSCHNSITCTLLELEDSVRNHIVFFLNEIRDIESRGEPSPSGIPILQYDKDLEEISMCWASQCVLGRSDCFITARFNNTSQTVGQKTFKRGKTAINLWNEILADWLGGVDILNLEIMMHVPDGEEGEMIFNYAQLLSDKIKFIGCSWALYNNKYIIFVCTLGPKGPKQGEFICKTGKSCSECPNGYKCDFKNPFANLCKPVVERKQYSKYIAKNENLTRIKKSEDQNEHFETTDKKIIFFITIIITVALIIIVFIIGGFIVYYMVII